MSTSDICNLPSSKKSSAWNLLLELVALFRVHGVEHVYAQPLSQLFAVVQQ
jgi:hypothetical protein